MAADDGGFGFGDFTFATPQPLSINGGLTSTSTSQDDDDWGDFFVAPSQPQPTLSSGFSLPSQSNLIPPPNNSKPTINCDPFSANPTRPASEPSPTRSDPGSNGAQKPGGALPLSLFGEVKDKEDEPNSIESKNNNHSNGLFDPKFPAQNGKIEVGIVSNGGGFNNNGGVFANLYIQSQQIKPEIGSGLNPGVSASDLNSLDDVDEGDEWEFMGASPGNGIVKENEEQGAFVLPRSEADPKTVMTQEKQAGQGASGSAEHKQDSNRSPPQFIDLFAAHHGASPKSNEVDVGLNNSSTMVHTNGFMPDLFHGVETIGNGTGISVTSVHEDDDFDDFGDFVDASQEFGPQKQEAQCGPHNNVAQLPNENIQDHQIQPENSRGPLPLSLFSDGLEEPIDALEEPSVGLRHQDEIIPKPISNPRNGFGTQVQGMSIHDLLSNLYSQAQPTSSVDSNKNPAENGVHSPQKTEDSTPFNDDDDWDDNSWEFKDALSETGIREQSSCAILGTVPQKLSETTSNVQCCIDFYAKLKECLCVLLSHQLDEEKKSQSSDTVDDNGNTEAFSHDIQEAYKLLEGNMTTEEILLKKHLDRSHCLNEVLEVLQGPNCKVIESAYSLSERLQLATSDWRIAAELLMHAISVLRLLSLGSADDQSIYVSSWSKIISVCAQELKHGALIWKRALEKNVQAQILSNHRGQQCIQALGEIYKVVELLMLSTKVYKPWVVLCVSDAQQLCGHLEECVSLWCTSGLEEALRQISNDVGLGLNKAAKALIASTKNIHNFDVLAVHDCVFIQRQSICRLSLLPQEMLSDLKVVLWNNEPYFVNLANLWANLMSPNPPELPRLLVN